jgi:hypothetical protein
MKAGQGPEFVLRSGCPSEHPEQRKVDMIRWLQQQGVVRGYEAKIFENSVKKNHKDLPWGTRP